MWDWTKRQLASAVESATNYINTNHKRRWRSSSFWWLFWLCVTLLLLIVHVNVYLLHNVWTDGLAEQKKSENERKPPERMNDQLRKCRFLRFDQLLLFFLLSFACLSTTAVVKGRKKEQTFFKIAFLPFHLTFTLSNSAYNFRALTKKTRRDGESGSGLFFPVRFGNSHNRAQVGP